ncbi:MAG: hypothetical protein ACRDR6_11700 [Pseudonocardiaceae bacterium]
MMFRREVIPKIFDHGSLKRRSHYATLKEFQPTGESVGASRVVRQPGGRGFDFVGAALNPTTDRIDFYDHALNVLLKGIK